MSPFTVRSPWATGRTSSPKRSKSMTRTWYPAASSFGTRIAPTYPAPPVTRTVPRAPPMSRLPINRNLLDVDRPPQPKDSPQRLQNIPGRHRFRPPVGTIPVGEWHFDVAVPGPDRVHEHLGEEVEAPRRLGKAPGERGWIDAGALKIPEPEAEDGIHQSSGRPRQYAPVELASPAVAVVRHDDVGGADGRKDVADRFRRDLPIAGKESEIVELRFVERPIVRGRDAEVPRLMNDTDASVLFGDALGHAPGAVSAPIVDEDHLVVGERRLGYLDDVAQGGLHIRCVVVRRHEDADAMRVLWPNKGRRRTLGHQTHPA